MATYSVVAVEKHAGVREVKMDTLLEALGHAAALLSSRSFHFVHIVTDQSRLDAPVVAEMWRLLHASRP